MNEVDYVSKCLITYNKKRWWIEVNTMDRTQIIKIIERYVSSFDLRLLEGLELKVVDDIIIVNYPNGKKGQIVQAYGPPDNPIFWEYLTVRGLVYGGCYPD